MILQQDELIAREFRSVKGCLVNHGEIDTFLAERLADLRGGDPDTVLRGLAQGASIDSLEGLDLAIAAETEFGISIFDDELSSGVCQSVPAIALLVRSKLVRLREGTEAAR